MTFRFLHLADLHLDSVYGGGPETAARLRKATQEALTAAASFALDQRLDAVLVAGDAFDDDRLGFEARGVLRREFLRLAAGGVTVVYVTGNHDPGTASGRAAALALASGAEQERSRLAAPIHVILDGSPRVLRVAGHGGGPGVGLVLCAGHATARVTDNPVRRTYEETDASRESALPRVGLFHTQVATASGADGHQPYAPSTIGDFAALDLDYAALGHVHVRGRIDESIPAYYAGNLQGRNAREHGPKGGLLVEVTSDGLEEEPEFVPLAPVEFFRCHLSPRVLTPEVVAEAVLRALDEARAFRTLAFAAELVIRAELASEGGEALAEDLEPATLDELRISSGLLGIEFIAVELRRARSADAAVRASRSELLERVEAHDSALRACLEECRRRDADGVVGTSLEEALLSRLERAAGRA